MGPERLRAASESPGGARRTVQVRLRHRPELAALHPQGERLPDRGGAGRGVPGDRSRRTTDPEGGGGLPGAARRGPVPAYGAGHAGAVRERPRHRAARPGRHAEQARARPAATLRADGAAVPGRRVFEPGRAGRQGHRASGGGPRGEPGAAALLRLRIVADGRDHGALLGGPAHAAGEPAPAGGGRRASAGNGPGRTDRPHAGGERGAGGRGRSRPRPGRRPAAGRRYRVGGSRGSGPAGPGSEASGMGGRGPRERAFGTHPGRTAEGATGGTYGAPACQPRPCRPRAREPTRIPGPGVGGTPEGVADADRGL